MLIVMGSFNECDEDVSDCGRRSSLDIIKGRNLVNAMQVAEKIHPEKSMGTYISRKPYIDVRVAKAFPASMLTNQTLDHFLIDSDLLAHLDVSRVDVSRVDVRRMSREEGAVHATKGRDDSQARGISGGKEHGFVGECGEQDGQDGTGAD